MSGTISSNSTSGIFNNPTLLKELTDIKDKKVGQGNAAGTTQAPPVPLSKAAANALGDSLLDFMSVKGDVEVLLVELAVTMRDAEAGNQKGKITTDQETKKAEAKDNQKKLEEAQKKFEEAQAKKNGGSILDKIKLAFEWLGALLAVVAAVALIASGAGAFAGAMMIGAAATSLVMATDSTVQMATGKGIAGNIAKLAGASDEDAAKADMGFRISLAVIGIGFAIAGGGASVAGAAKAGASAGMEAAKVGKQLGETGAQLAKDALKASYYGAKEGATVGATTTFKLGARMAGQATSVVNAGVSTGTATVDAARAGVGYQEKDLRAQAKDLEAEAKKSEATMARLDDLIDQALSRLMGASQRFNAILDDIMATIDDRAKVLSKV